MLNDFVEIFLGCFYNFFPPDTYNSADMQLLAGVVAVASMLILLLCVCGTVCILAHGCILIVSKMFGGARQ